MMQVQSVPPTHLPIYLYSSYLTTSSTLQNYVVITTFLRFPQVPTPSPACMVFFLVFSLFWFFILFFPKKKKKGHFGKEHRHTSKGEGRG
jgi:hypothetical protein